MQLKRLEQHQPEYDCLYRGSLTPDLAEVVPYLVHLEKNSEFLWWVLEQGHGQHWGIFALSFAHLRTLRQHFHRLLTVQDARGKSFYFRFYDPRVLRVYLPTCHAQEKTQVFGPVERYFIEKGEREKGFLPFSA